MKEKLLENKKKVLENLYLTVFAVFCLYFFMWTTTFWVSWPDFFVSDLRTVMIALIVVKASVSEKKSNWKELVFEIGLIAVFLAVKNRNGQEILLDTLLLILGAKEIASEKLIRVYTVTIATALFVTIGASLLGIIENLSYAQPGRMTRMAFGIGYPTDFGAHVLFLLLCYFYLRRKKIQYVELAITVLIGGLICTIGEAGIHILTEYCGMEQKNASAWVSIGLVAVSAVCTGLGWYAKLGKHAGAGTLVPITGFANAIVSPAMEFKSEGLVLGVGAALLCTSAATLNACGQTLKEWAAQLLLPKAPKAGKRIFLERITPVWKRMKFTHKVTARNLFRYKARFFMMILGIGGCTALIVTALALQDNFMGVSDLQYNEIDLYDANASFNESLSQEDMDAFLDANGERVAGALFTYTGNMDISANGTTHSVSMNAPIAGGDLGDFFSWHADGTEYSLPEDGELLLDRGLADRLGVQTGDEVTVRDSDMHETTLKICGVYDNYISNNAYISRGTLENAFGKTDVNSAFINFKGDEDVHEQAAALMNADDNITNVTIASDNQSMFTDMLDSLNIIVIVVILCAGALAFIVLYNLTNINISERIREIATLKVLGFYSNEANAYVFRENTALTVFGALAGLVLGKFFHAFVMAQIVVDGLSFDAYVTPQNYAIAFVLTIVFAFITQLIMRRKISRIHMAESLKSVE